MGGGVTILFITGLAASELYGLVGGGAALLFQGLVAVTAFSIATRQRDTVMASIATLGALVPPAFLLQDAVAGPVLWLYLALVTAWAALLVARHEPRAFSMLAVAAAVVAMFRTVPDDAATRSAAIAMLVTVWLGFAALPLLRSLLAWAHPLRAGVDRDAGVRLAQPFLVTLAVAAALEAKVLATSWSFEAGTIAAAAGFALLAAFLYGRRPAPQADALSPLRAVDSDDFAAAVAAGAACLVAFTLAGVPFEFRFPAVAAIATAAFLAARPLHAPVLSLLAHALFAGCVIALGNNAGLLTARPAFDTFALGYAGVGALAAAVAWRSRDRHERTAYSIGVFILLHILLATELGAIAAAPWLASAAYAIVGAGLVVLGVRRQLIRVQQAGMVSLALLVVRLFAHDLANVDTGVRIVLFLACGFGFLGLSYLFRGRHAAT
jgi:hypothetical protein